MSREGGREGGREEVYSRVCRRSVCGKSGGRDRNEGGRERGSVQWWAFMQLKI